VKIGAVKTIMWLGHRRKFASNFYVFLSYFIKIRYWRYA